MNSKIIIIIIIFLNENVYNFFFILEFVQLVCSVFFFLKKKKFNFVLVFVFYFLFFIFSFSLFLALMNCCVFFFLNF
jgi:hypothetical protein